MVKIACQTIVFGNPAIKDNLAKIAETAKKIGYDGVEIGARHFYMDKLNYYKDVFAKLDLRVTALHGLGEFPGRDSVRDLVDIAKDTVNFAKALNCPYIYMSGRNPQKKTQEDYVAEAESYKKIGKICNDAGLIFCYHNHAWEFANNAEGMNTLLEKVPENLMKLVPDVGWVERAGVSSLQFLKDNMKRVEALHFKEFNKVSADSWEIQELGTGVVPFKEVYAYATSFNRDWWISAEQDTTKLDPAEAARINFEYIDNLRKKG